MTPKSEFHPDLPNWLNGRSWERHVVNQGGTIGFVKANGSIEQAKGRWEPNDRRLLRAANRVIRLYDLHQSDLFKVSAESLAKMIAQDLNRDSDEEE